MVVHWPSPKPHIASSTMIGVALDASTFASKRVPCAAFTCVEALPDLGLGQGVPLEDHDG